MQRVDLYFGIDAAQERGQGFVGGAKQYVEAVDATLAPLRTAEKRYVAESHGGSHESGQKGGGAGADDREGRFRQPALIPAVDRLLSGVALHSRRLSRKHRHHFGTDAASRAIVPVHGQTALARFVEADRTSPCRLDGVQDGV